MMAREKEVWRPETDLDTCLQFRIGSPGFCFFAHPRNQHFYGHARRDHLKWDSYSYREKLGLGNKRLVKIICLLYYEHLPPSRHFLPSIQIWPAQADALTYLSFQNAGKCGVIEDREKFKTWIFRFLLNPKSLQVLSRKFPILKI